jgi:BirA family biotin operon repressor/biotin-[acetyl-CoA-carboxylase] ligase
MPILADLARQGARHGTVVTASFQSAGTGRGGRVWHAPPDASLLLSVLIRTARPMRDAPLLSLLTAQAVAETIVSFGAHDVTLKWPNDVLVRQRKISGILLRSRAAADGSLALVAGIGINLTANAVGEVPSATCLESEVTGPFTRNEVLDRLMYTLGFVAERFERGDVEALLHAVNHRLAWRGERVSIEHGEGDTIQGVLSGLREDGALLLQPDSGGMVAILAGELQRGPQKLD